MTKTFFLASMALVLLGAGCTRATTPTAQAPVDEARTATSDNIITAQPQPAGRSFVNVAHVTLGEPGRVVVYEDNNGSSGTELGKSQIFKPGVYTVTVRVSRTTLPGEILHAVLRRENGTALKTIDGNDAVSTIALEN